MCLMSVARGVVECVFYASKSRGDVIIEHSWSTRVERTNLHLSSPLRCKSTHDAQTVAILVVGLLWTAKDCVTATRPS